MALRKARDVPRRPGEPARRRPGQELTPAEERLARIAAQAMRRMVNSTDARLIEEALRRDPMAVLSVLDFSVLIRAFEPARRVLASEMSVAATAYATRIGVQSSFRSVDPNVIRAAELSVGRMIGHVTDTTRDAIRRLVVLAFASQELTVHQVARLVGEVVGMTPRQAAAAHAAYQRVFQEALAGGSTPAQAEDVAARHVQRLRRRAVAARSRAIARTEILGASNSGRMLTWQEADRQGLIREGTTKEWIVAGGACPVCEPYGGQRVPWQFPFPNGVQMPPAHVMCRCTAVLVSPS